MSTDDLNGWREWSKYVLKELERNNADHDKILAKMTTIEGEIVALKVKAGMWGLMGGAIPVIVAMLMRVIN